MKKINIFISFLLFLLFYSQVNARDVQKAQDIPMYKKRAHLGARKTEPIVTPRLGQISLLLT